MAKRVPLNTVLETEQIVQHETERNTITQLIKVAAFRSESCLASLIEPFFARHDDEARAFLKTVFQLPGDILPDHDRQELRVRLYGLANNRSQQTLSALCDCLNTQQTTYPGTDLRLVFEAIQSHKICRQVRSSALVEPGEQWGTEIVCPISPGLDQDAKPVCEFRAKAAGRGSSPD